MTQFNILFTSVGRRVQLIKHFKETLKNLDLLGGIVTTDCKKNAPAFFISDYHELVPSVSDPNYIESIKEICRRYKINLLVPLIDTELSLMSIHKEEFRRMGITCLVSSLEVNEICFDKRNTYQFFKEAGVLTPDIIDVDLLLKNQNYDFPYIVKPVNGSSSMGVNKITNLEELKFFLKYTSNAFLQKHVDGDEYTLDVLVDFSGIVRSIVPRLRLETRAGEVSKGITVKNQAIIEAGKKVVEALPGALGCITLQCFLSKNNQIKFIEINPRFGGGVPLSFEAGADFPKWIIQWILGEDVGFEIDDWKDGLAMLRYDDAIFVENGAKSWY